LDALESGQTQLADIPSLTQIHALTAQDAAQGQIADFPTLSLVIDLLPGEADQGQAVDMLSLTQVHVLIVTESYQGQAADSPTLNQDIVLMLDESHQMMTSDVGTIEVWLFCYEKILLVSTIERTISAASMLGRSIALGSGLAFIQAGDSKLTRGLTLDSEIEKIIELNSELGLEN
jgi:hypothetical protein